ncbi:Phosphotyrosyl phosphatase activator [Lipomyces japonicus]|uniref:Phosphotyrosyl phosphatase activator n=1 Tax=Lipomyces japonicus TaxID=56871 RepID=UPI0034CDE8C0
MAEHNISISKSFVDEAIRTPLACKSVFNPRQHISFGPLDKKIHTHQDLVFFKRTITYNRIQFLVSFISSSVSGLQTPSPTTEVAEGIVPVLQILHRMKDLVDEIPAVTGPRRFGNPAYKVWFNAVQENTRPLIADLLRSKRVPASATDEIFGYLINSIGSFQRLDFGTGHELSFLAFFGGLLFLGVLNSNDNAQTGGVGGTEILAIFAQYYEIIRKVVRQYTLEPAGSHGVWGLDDHFHLVYIIGAAQLAGIEKKNERKTAESEGLKPPPARHQNHNRSDGITSSSTHVSRKKEADYDRYGMPKPGAVVNATIVADHAYTNLYFSAINFINSVKRGPFFEHSPVLYDISGVPTWHKVHAGLIKMYNAEVLGKFPVVQHFGFGLGLYPWEPVIADL